MRSILKVVVKVRGATERVLAEAGLLRPHWGRHSVELKLKLGASARKGKVSVESSQSHTSTETIQLLSNYRLFRKLIHMFALHRSTPQLLPPIMSSCGCDQRPSRPGQRKIMKPTFRQQWPGQLRQTPIRAYVIATAYLSASFPNHGQPQWTENHTLVVLPGARLHIVRSRMRSMTDVRMSLPHYRFMVPARQNTSADQAHLRGSKPRESRPHGK